MKHYETLEIVIDDFQTEDVIRTSTTEDEYDWLSGELNEDGTFK